MILAGALAKAALPEMQRFNPMRNLGTTSLAQGGIVRSGTLALSMPLSGPRASTLPVHRPNIPGMIWCQVVLAALPLVAWVLFKDGVGDADSLVQLWCVALTLQPIWMIYSWKRMGGEVFSPYTIFAVAVFLFNAGQAVLEVLGLNTLGLLGRKVPESILAETVLLVFYGLSSMHFGALISAVTKSRGRMFARFHVPPSTFRQIGVALFVVSVVPSIMVWRQAVNLVVEGGYGAIYTSDRATGIGSAPLILSGFLIPSAFLLLAGGRSKRTIRRAAFTIIACYVLASMFVGFRGQAVAVLVAFLWLWHQTIRKIPITAVLALLAGLGVFVLPLVGVIRTASGVDRMSVSTVSSAYSQIQNPAVSILYDVGGTMLAPAYTLELVPSQRPYDLGLSYAYAGLAFFPNLFWEVHPTSERALSTWLVNTAEPQRAALHGGLGYSIIAEAYLNFGFAGSALPMALTGWVLGRMSKWSEAGRATDITCFVAIALASLILWSRGESAEVVRGVVWYAAIPYFIVTLWQRPRARLPM